MVFNEAFIYMHGVLLYSVGLLIFTTKVTDLFNGIFIYMHGILPCSVGLLNITAKVTDLLSLFECCRWIPALSMIEINEKKNAQDCK